MARPIHPLSKQQQQTVLSAHRIVRAEVSRFCGRRRAWNQQDDLAQAAWEQLCQAVTGFEGRCQFTTLATTAVRRALFRTYYERVMKERLGESEEPTALPCTEDRLDGAFLAREIRRQVIATEGRGGRSTLPAPYERASQNADAFIACLIDEPHGLPKGTAAKLKGRLSTRVLEPMRAAL